MKKISFNYRVKRGELSGTWYIYHVAGTKELYTAGTLRDCVIQCLCIEGMV